MIHAYDNYYLSLTQHKLAVMFELAVYYEKLDIDEFAEKFVNSNVCKAFEKGDPVLVCGKSANELLGLVLSKEAVEVEQSMSCPPEYWVGYVLAYAQWYFNVSFKELTEKFPCSQLMMSYFPYHEMDIMHAMDLIAGKLQKQNPLKEMRLKRGLSQTELSRISRVPLRSIKAYEQGTCELSKAKGETLYVLARTLDCTIEYLLK